MLKAVFKGKVYKIISMTTFGYERYIFILTNSENVFNTASLEIIGNAKIKRHKIYINETNY